MKKNLFLIHGAWCTKKSFNYLIDSLHTSKSSKNINDVVCFEYDNSKRSIREIIDSANKQLTKLEKDTIIIGHSLGGLVALALEDNDSVSDVITVASPTNGLRVGVLLEFYLQYREPAIHDIMHHSGFIEFLHKKDYDKPIYSLIANSGFNPFILEKSDGIIPVSAQKKWIPDNASLIEIDCNHTEILQSEEFVDVVKNVIIS